MGAPENPHFRSELQKETAFERSFFCALELVPALFGLIPLTRKTLCRTMVPPDNHISALG
jgi:hypothetical protein